MKVVTACATVRAPDVGERVRVKTRAGVLDAIVREKSETLLVVEILGELHDARLHFSPFVRPFWEIC